MRYLTAINFTLNFGSRRRGINSSDPRTLNPTLAEGRAEKQIYSLQNLEVSGTGSKRCVGSGVLVSNR